MKDAISVLVTGSAGRVGSAVCAALRARGHKVRGLDVRATGGLDDMILGDIADAAAVRGAMRGIDAVIHLAATPDEDDFMTRLLPNNIVGVYNVLEAARLSGVRQVMLASTGQVVMGHAGPFPITPAAPFSPRNWYASAKVMAEVAGQFYAHLHGLNVIVARLGWCPRDRQHAEELARSEWGRNVYMSPADAGRFFVCVVESTQDRPFCTVFVTSKPAGEPRYDTTSTHELFGYQPQDTWPEGIEWSIPSPDTV